LAHGDTLLLSVTPPRLVASAATIGGVTLRENPEPSMGAGKVLLPAWIAWSMTASPSVGCSAASPAARS
jgi:hypothetical protein